MSVSLRTQPGLGRISNKQDVNSTNFGDLRDRSLLIMNDEV